MKKYKIGMYGGKFMPLHKGHNYCIETAASESEKVYVILFYGGSDELKILENNNLKGNGQCQPVYQIDRNTGEIINQFQSLKEVEKELGLHKTQIWSAVNGQAKTAGGYCWCKIQDIDNFNLQQHIDNKQTKVMCKENGKIFNSFADAARWLKEKGYSNNPSRSNLSKICNIPNRTAYKFHWLTFDN